jgi:hypothetical protein
VNPVQLNASNYSDSSAREEKKQMSLSDEVYKKYFDEMGRIKQTR